MPVDHTRLPELIGPIARELLGVPNQHLSNKNELRYGSNGSLSVNLAKGTFYDHEAQAGGGALDLVTRETGLQGEARLSWVETRFPEITVTDRPKSNGKQQPAPLGKEVAWYDYLDEAGALLFQVVRYEPKTFRQRRRARPDDEPWKVHNSWVWGARGVRSVPYRLPELIEAVSVGQRVFLVEGEKDCENLRALGAIATCNAGGVGKWSEALNEYFRGADVIVIQDNDPQARNPKGELLFHQDGRPRFPGQDHARDVCAHLSGVAERVCLLDLAGAWIDCPKKGDISDWITAGGTIEALNDLTAFALDWTPELPTLKPESGKLLIQSNEEFMAGYQAAEYLVDGMLQRAYLYSLTGQTGHSKTAVSLLLTQLVSLRGNIEVKLGHRGIDRGRVIYLAGENPDDVRMRQMGAVHAWEWPEGQDGGTPQFNIGWITGQFDIGGAIKELQENCLQHGEASLIVIDTSAVYFLGDDEINNVQMGNHARMLRKLCELPGRPTVLVLCHPIKNVTEPSQLVPRGGGAFLNEMDGNITLWRTADDTAVMAPSDYKFRGYRFPQVSFRIELLKDVPTIKDKKGRLMPTVRAVVISQVEEEQADQKVIDDENRLLAVMLREPELTQRAIAERIGWRYETTGEPNPTRVNRILARLARVHGKNKLVDQDRGNRYRLTERGKAVAREYALTHSQPEPAPPVQLPLLPEPPAFVQTGIATAGTACVGCKTSGGTVFRYRKNEPGAKTEPLHPSCAPAYFER